MEETPHAAQIVVAGHVCLDIIPALDRATWPESGRLNRIGPAAVSLGGAVGNTGLALYRLGVPVRLMGKVGDDAFGRVIIDILRQHGDSLAEAMIRVNDASTSYTIVINPPGIDRSFMHFPGANDTFKADEVRTERLAGARLFHFGYPPLMHEMCADGGVQLHLLFQRVHDAGLATSLDMAQPDPDSDAGKIDWELFLGRVLPAVDVFSPSIDELLFMLDRPTFSQLGEVGSGARLITGSLLQRLGDRLIQMGATVVAIKLGNRGLFLATASTGDRIESSCQRVGLNAAAWQGREVYSPCFRAKEVSGTTGAGDCTIAGFLAALLRGDDPLDATTSATAVGACSVEAADATSGVPPWSVVKDRLLQGWQRLPTEMSWNQDVVPLRNSNGSVELKPRRKL
jgi:sugar/nucleoside kinase (ribokinase family)